MDQRLLSALENLGNALEEIASALQSKEESKSSTVEAMKGGDFGKQLESINAQLKSIKADTQALLKQQKTIPAMSKEKEKGGKSDTDGFKNPMAEIGADKKKESAILKGLGVILLIAVAVLAIGMAFKLVGKIDFLSVIALASAIFLISLSFEKVASLKLSLKDALVSSAALVMMAAAVTISSWILRKIVPVGILQTVTGILIATMFTVMAPKLENIFIAASVAAKLRVRRSTLLTTLVSISAAITLSSWILTKIVILSPLQAITAILIAGMFTVISMNFEKIAFGVTLFRRFNVGKLALVTTLTSIAAAITASSWILQGVVPIGLAKAITAILIAAMFLVITLNFEKIAASVAAFQRFKISKFTLVLTLVGIAAAITASSHILAETKPIGLMQFITALGVAILFAIMSYVMPELAAGVFVIDKALGKVGVLMIPVIFVALALAIMLSSHILAETASLNLAKILQIVGFGLALALVVFAMMPSVLAVGIAAASGVGAGAILLGVVLIPLIAGAIALSSHALSMGKYAIYPGIGWAASVGILMTVFSLAVLGLGIIAVTGVGLVAILAGASLVPVIAETIVKTDKEIAKGKYTIFPGWKWIASVGATMTGFGLAVLTLGLLAVTGVGLVAILAGASLVPVIAETIVKTDKEIAKGKYDKFPGWRWIASVGATMTGFGLAVLTLGLLAVTGVGYVAILLGASLVPKVAQAIVDTDEIIAKGKYQKQPGFRWIASVALSMTLFGAAVVALGAIAVTGIGAVALWAGTEFVPMIAKTIVAADKEIAKGRYSKYPGIEWAASVGSLMTIFGLAVLTLGSFVVGTFGFGKAALNAGRSAVKLIAQSVVDVAWIFNKNNAAFKFGPSKDWADGVAIALGAFSPVYSMLVRGGIMKAIFGTSVTPTQFSEAIKVISQGIVDAAWFFQGAEAAFVGGPKKEWSEGVGKAIGAFAPVYKILADEKGFFGSGVSIWAVKKAVKAISWGIVASAKIFSSNSAPFEKYPSKEWASGVSLALKAFSPIIKMLMSDSLFISGASKIKTLIAGIKGISSAIVYTAKTLSSVKDWQAMSKTGVPTRLWSYRMKVALQSMSRTARTLKAKEKELYMVQRTAYAIAATANIFRSARKAFGDRVKTDVMWWSRNLLGPKGVFHEFVNLSKWLKQQEKSMQAGSGSALGAIGEGLLAAANPIGFIAMKMTGPSSKSTGDLVADTALKIVRVARILHQNKKFFQLNIDPNFMKKVGKNILDFNFIVQKLAESEGSKGFLASIGDSMNSMFGNDPISKIARRMVTLAGAYDKLASALIKLGGAMRMLNISDARRLGGITAGIASGQSPEEPETRRREVTAVRTEVGRVREPGAGRGKSNHEVNQMNMIKKLDQIVKVLKNIDRSVASVDDFISDQTEGKYPSAGGGKLF